MKNLIASIALAILTVGTTAINTEATETSTRESRCVNLDNFNKISVGQGIIVNYSPFGADSYATISAPANVIDNIEITVKDNCLKVDYANSYAEVRHYGEAVVNVKSPGLCTDYECHSAGTIDVRSSINAPAANLNIEASTDGLISFKDVACNQLNIECRSGSKVVCDDVKCDDVICESTAYSKVDLSGNCNNYRLVANTKSTINASELTAITGDVISGERCIVMTAPNGVNHLLSPDTNSVADAR